MNNHSFGDFLHSLDFTIYAFVFILALLSPLFSAWYNQTVLKTHLPDDLKDDVGDIQNYINDSSNRISFLTTVLLADVQTFVLTMKYKAESWIIVSLGILFLFIVVLFLSTSPFVSPFTIETKSGPWKPSLYLYYGTLLINALLIYLGYWVFTQSP